MKKKKKTLWNHKYYLSLLNIPYIEHNAQHGIWLPDSQMAPVICCAMFKVACCVEDAACNRHMPFSSPFGELRSSLLWATCKICHTGSSGQKWQLLLRLSHTDQLHAGALPEAALPPPPPAVLDDVFFHWPISFDSENLLALSGRSLAYVNPLTGLGAGLQQGLSLAVHLWP